MRPRTIAEKNVTGRENARRALDAYRATGGQDPDDVVAIQDLIADLLHLADEAIKTAVAEEGCEVAWDGNVTVVGIAYRAFSDYEYEADPANADEGA
jgi:hypothetical protein